MNTVIDQLFALQQLQLPGRGKSTETEVKIQELRETIPVPILGHYDRCLARGKKGVALVRNGVCTECHMRLPIGVVAVLMRRTDIQLCGNCGRYLYLPADPEAPTPVPEVKPAVKRRKPRPAVHVQ